MIIVEGPDHSGKTTLIKEILKAYPDLLALKSRGPSTNYDFWMMALTRPPEEVGKLVCDRFFYSEYVYGPLIRQKVSLSTQQQEVIHSMLIAAEPLVVQCHLIEDERSFNLRPQIFDWETTKKTEALFNLVLGPQAALQFWPTVNSQTRHVMARVRVYLETMHAWESVRGQCPYGRGQMRSPRLMIVGEKFSSNNKWKVPFERSKSGVLLHNTLRGTGFSMEEIWFTNAIKISEALSPMNLAAMRREVELIQPQEVVALGNRASGLLSAVGVNHTKIRHPGWYLRKYSTQKAQQEFCDEFNLQMELEGDGIG